MNKEEIEQDFICACRSTCVYWHNLENVSEFDKIQGAVFSILVLLDGVSSEFKYGPVKMMAHVEDEKNEENRYEIEIFDDCMLHDQFYSTPD